MRKEVRRQLLLFAVIIIIAAVILYLGRIFREVMLAAVAAGLLYYLSLPIVGLLERWKIPRILAILIVFLIFAAATVFLFVYLVPIVIEQLTSLASDVPAVFARMERWFERFEAQVGEAQFQELINRAATTAAGYIETAATSILGILGNVLSVLLVAVIGAVAAFYLLLDHERIGDYIYRYVPDDIEPDVRSISKSANTILAGFLQGRIIVAVIVGTAAGVALAIIGVPYAFILGVITAVLELVPYIGPILAAIPAVLIAFTISPTTALLTVALYFIIQQIESLILTPRVVGAHVHLHPVTVIFAVLVGEEILGVIGVFIAMPVAGIVKVLVEHVLLPDSERKTD